jgi:hypothetical protein
MEFIAGDADISGNVYKFNNQQSTLLIKGGSDVLDYIEKIFSHRPIEYKSLIIEKSVNKLEDLEGRFAQDGYDRCFYLKGEDFLPPYAMQLKNAYIFLKNTLKKASSAC